jgi:hypothetical protein
MSRRSVRAALSVALVLLYAHPLPAQDLTGPEIISRVRAARETTGFRARARLERTTAGSQVPAVWQFAITGRYESGGSQLLYLVQRPSVLKGHALVLNRTAGGRISGFFFEPPDTVRELSQHDLGEPLFGSDLLLEDVTDAYLYWPLHRLAGEGIAFKRNCLVIDSQPGADISSRYSRVRSCVVPELNLPVRVEKFDRRGVLAKTILAEKVVRQGNVWVASVLGITPPDQGWRSSFTFLRGERGLNVAPDEFTPAHIRQMLVAPPGNRAPISGRPGS